MSLPGGESEPGSPTAAEAGTGLGRATAFMAVGTLLSRVTGLLRLLVAAYALGGNSLSDAFNLANNTPNLVHDLVLGGVLSATFVPQFVHRLASRPRREAEESISAVVSLSSVVLFGATVVFLLAAPYIIDLYSIGAHSAGIAAERDVATDLLRLFAIQLVGYGTISLMGAVLNTVRRFVLVAFVGVLNNVIAIAVLVEFARVVGRHPTLAQVQHDHGAILLLGLGTSAGVVVQAVALLPATLRSGLHLRFVWRPGDPAIREIRSLSSWTFGFVVANQITVFVVLALAVHLGPARVTDYTYAYQFFQLPFGMIAVSVMSAVIPELSYRWSRRDLPEMAHQFGLGMRRMMAGILPATAGYLLLSGPLISLLLRHRDFGSANAHETAVLLTWMAVGLPGYCAYLLCISALQAMRDTRTAFFLYLYENVATILLAVLLTEHVGVAGLSLSLSLAYSSAAIAALFVVRSRMGSLGGRPLARFLLRSFVLTLLMAAAVAAVAAAVSSSSDLGPLLEVVAGVLAGVITYGAAAGLAATISGWQTARKRPGAKKGAHGYHPSRH